MLPLGHRLRSAAAAHRVCRCAAPATALQVRGANETGRSSLSALPAAMAQRRRTLCTGPTQVEVADYVVVGAGPVGASTAWFLSEHEQAEDKSIVMIHDPTDRGAHEDWSRLARLSFDGPPDEMTLSRHAVSLLDLVDEVRSYQSGAPVVPMRPGMLFLAVAERGATVPHHGHS